MNSIEVNKEVLDKIFMKVRVLEGKNLRTAEFQDKDMVKTIINIIDAEIEKERKDEV